MNFYSNFNLKTGSYNNQERLQQVIVLRNIEDSTFNLSMRIKYATTGLLVHDFRVCDFLESVYVQWYIL